MATPPSTPTSSLSPPRTALEWLTYGEALLESHPLYYGHGRDNAGDEAAALITHALNISPTQSEESLQVPLSEAEQQSLQQLFQQRIKERLPVPYLTQQIHFTGYPFYIDQRAIIPRSPMGEIILEQFQSWLESNDDNDSPQQLSLLDLCCGSGCLGIASWLHCDFIEHIYLCDISHQALEVAKINAQKYDLLDKLHILQGDLFNALTSPQGTPNKRFDIILCNPPYVDVSAMQSLPKEYLHEPALALDGRKNPHSQQQDGLEIVDQIIKQCGAHLQPTGWLFLEVGASKDAFERKYQHLYPLEVELESHAEGVYAIAASVLQS